MNPHWLLVIPAVLALWLAEWGKVKCGNCHGNKKFRLSHDRMKYAVIHDCGDCHGTGRVRRRWIIKLWRK